MRDALHRNIFFSKDKSYFLYFWENKKNVVIEGTIEYWTGWRKCSLNGIFLRENHLELHILRYQYEMHGKRTTFGPMYPSCSSTWQLQKVRQLGLGDGWCANLTDPEFRPPLVVGCNRQLHNKPILGIILFCLLVAVYVIHAAKTTYTLVSGFNLWVSHALT